jgi:pilus assembly protein CpaB
MRGKSLLLLMLALGCGLIASIGITRVMATRSTDGPEATAEMEAIYVAIEDIPTGDRITAEMIRTEEWPLEKIPEDAIRELESVVEQRPKSRIYAGQPILQRQLSEGTSATSHIPDGYRVVPVKVDAVSGGSSMIRPGDRVDVTVHLQKCPNKSIPKSEVRMVLQDVKVFAINDVYEAVDDTGDQIKAQTISLMVTPAQAQKVILAEESGKIRLVMRGPGGEEPAEVAEVTMEDLLGGGTEVADRAEESDAMQDLYALPGSGPPNEFIDALLNGQGTSCPAAGPPLPQTVQWRMRVIAGDEVREELMELDAPPPADASADGSAAPGSSGGKFSFWRMMSDVASAAAARPAETGSDAGPAEDVDPAETDTIDDDGAEDGETIEGPELEADEQLDAGDGELANRRR